MSKRNTIALAGAIIATGALAMAGQAGADPAVPTPTPTISVGAIPAPAGATPAPGQPVVGSGYVPVDPAPPPPVGTRTVPEIQNPTYGQGQSPGQLGYLRDLWHTFHSGNPMEALTEPAEQAPGPPPGAGPPPPLPPGYISLTAPRPTTDPVPGANSGTDPAVRPPLPPGYVSLNAPQPAPADPAAPVTIVPVPPTP